MALKIPGTSEVAVIGLGSSMREVRARVDGWRWRWNVDVGRAKRFHIWGRLSLVFGDLHRGGSAGLHPRYGGQRFKSSMDASGEAFAVELADGSQSLVSCHGQEFVMPTKVLIDAMGSWKERKSG